MLRPVRAILLSTLFVSLAATSCSNEVTGPAPKVLDDPETGQPTDPSFACNEQVEGWITLFGEDFSPLVVDSLDRDNGASVEFPTITLTLSQTIEGEAQSSQSSVTLQAADAEDETQVRWVDGQTLQFRVDPSLELEAGIYDVTVENPNGENITREAAFGVLPRPTVSAAVPDLVCVAQGARQVEVSGDFFLMRGDENPTVQVGEKIYEPTALSECRTLGAIFGGHEVCKKATIEVPEADFEPGAYRVGVTNFEPAACASLPEEDAVNLVIVAPPTIADIQAEPICSEQLDYDSMTITGTGFLKIGGDDGERLPTVTVGSREYTAKALENCEPVEGLANQTAESCTTLVFEVAADDLAGDTAADAVSTNLAVQVTNPDPAGCATTEDVELTVVPAPTVADIQFDPICTEQFDNEMTVTGTGFLTVDGVLPEVQVGPNTYTPSVAEDCVAVEGPAASVESCQTLRLTVPQGDLPDPNNYSVIVTNPADAACVSQEDVQVTVVPPPTVAAVTPQPICTTDADNLMAVDGEGFLVIDGVLPTVEVGTESYQATAVSGCMDVPVQEDGMNSVAQTCTALEFTIPQDSLPDGNFSVVVVNPEPAACASTEDADLTIVPPPALTTIVEELACLDEESRSFTISGTDFLIVDGAVPSVRVGPNTYQPDSVDDCTALTVTGATAESCTSLTFTVPQGDLAPGAHDVVVTNPTPAACASSEVLQLTVAAPPAIADVQPDVVCSEQNTNTIVISGTGFLSVDGALPTVTIDGTPYTPSAANDCMAVTSVVNSAVQTCNELVVDVPADTLTNGQNAVVVTNPQPAGCSSTETQEVTAVPPPVLASVTSDFTCVETQMASLTLTGSNFLTLNGALPDVTIGGQLANTVGAEGCAAVPGANGAESCTTLQVEVPQGLVAAGAHDVVVTNPGTANCSSSEPVSLEVLAAPAVADAQPDLFCNDNGATTITVTGTDFLIVDGVNPEVVVGGQTFTATNLQGCNAVAGVSANVQSCTSLEVTVPEQSLATGLSDVVINNPDPAGCTSSTHGEVLVAGAPNLTNVQPQGICDDGSFDGVVTLTGDTFLVIDGEVPTVDVNGTQVMPDSLNGCVASQGVGGRSIEDCTELVFTVPEAMRADDLAISLVNPAPADCGSATLDLVLERTPKIASVTPALVCNQNTMTIVLTGQDFLDGMSVSMGGVEAQTVTVDATGESATAEFPANAVAAGEYVVQATNPNMCVGTSSETIRVTNGAQVVFADPPVVYDGVSTQIIIYLSGLFGAEVTDVTLEDSAGTMTQLSISYDPAKPGQVQAVVPAGTLPDGLTTELFDIHVTDSTGCTGRGDDLIEVTSEIGLALDAVTPPFGGVTERTAVTITALDPPPAGMEQFVATPRVYLNPANPQPGDIARELRSVQFIDATELDGIIDAGLPIGTYDIIVVNPTGTVGVLQDAFEIMANEPPLIDSVSPGSWKTNEAALPILIEGANFRNVSVTTECIDSNGNPLSAAVTVSSNTSNTIDATVDTTTLSHQSVCVLIVTDNDDGTYAEYSPVTVFNPAGNFVDFSPGPAMNVARRASAATSGTPSRVARFIYSIGGDDGDVANAMTDTEASRLDRFGRPTAWFSLPYVLPSGRTLTDAVRIGDFVYLPGGHDGAGPTNSVLRAEVLDPLFSPQITSVDLAQSEYGMPTGVYYYRVSAVLDTTDPANPGGETLASDPQAVRLPVGGLEVTISWSPPPGNPDVLQYNVYRSPQPDTAYGNEELIAVVPGNQTQFKDDGQAMTLGDTPLPLGALGVWHEVAQLATARHSHAVAVARDPADPSAYYLYTFGGYDGTGVLGSYEYVPITVNGPRDQVVTANATVGAEALSIPRMELAALSASPENANRLAGPYIYIMGGMSDPNTRAITRRIEIAEVTAGGELGTFMISGSSMQTSRAGYAAAVANNNLVTAGGANAAPDGGAEKVEICDNGATSGPNCPPPELRNWSSLSQVNLQPRYLMGYTAFRGFFYLVGGVTSGGAITNTVDYSALGGNP